MTVRKKFRIGGGEPDGSSYSAAERSRFPRGADVPTVPLPLGSIKPRGWLKEQISLAAGGMTGKLGDISDFLKSDNGWLCPEYTTEDLRRDTGRADEPYFRSAWEEQAYWLRGAFRLAVMSDCEALYDTCIKYINTLINSAEPDGWFGPQVLKNAEPERGVFCDIWPHMVIGDLLFDYYEYTSDRRALRLLLDFCRFCMNLPDDQFISGGWKNWQGVIQYQRCGDMIPLLSRLYALTGDESLPKLAGRFYKVYLSQEGDEADNINAHVVNFAQRFRYSASYWKFSRDEADILKSERLYDEHIRRWGQMPGGVYAADERTREGKHDPRQGFETCAMAEIVNSFMVMSCVTGDPLYSDRIEDVIFNSAPAAFTPDHNALHYLTAPNQLTLDAETHDYTNQRMQTRYTAFGYRCCQHNAGMLWPSFVNTAFLHSEAPDGTGHDLTAWSYCPCELETNVDSHPVRIVEETDYPFENTVRFKVTSDGAIFAVYFRIPDWSDGLEININGKDWSAEGQGNLLEVLRAWKDDEVLIRFRPKIRLRHFPQNGDCVCVDCGPLTYSLALEEEWIEADRHIDKAGNEWSDWDVMTKTPYAYALNLSKPITVENKKPAGSLPFTTDGAPITLKAWGRPIEWGMSIKNTIDPVPQSPVHVPDGEDVPLLLRPMGCQRVRLSCFPWFRSDE